MADKKLGLTTTPRGTWVQTDRSAHEQWAQLSMHHPKASALLHLLISQMGRHNAVIISQRNIMRLLGCARTTVIRAVDTLTAQGWLEVKQIGPTGSTNAYIINDRVAWSGARDGIRYSLFSAAVVVSEDEQPDQGETNENEPLIKIPELFSGEQQLPTGDGLEPPTEPQIPGLESDLPSRDYDPETGEIMQTDIEDFTSND